MGPESAWEEWCDRLMPHLLQHWHPGGQSVDESVSTMQLKEAPSAGLAPGGSSHKRSLGAEPWGRRGARVVELAASPCNRSEARVIPLRNFT